MPCPSLPSVRGEGQVLLYRPTLRPYLVARSYNSDTRWEVPASPDTYQKLQDFRASLDGPFDQDWDADVAFKRKALLDSIKLKRLYRSPSHILTTAWEGYLRPIVCAFLDGVDVKWNSVGPFYIGSEDQFVPVLLIGVDPRSISGGDGSSTTHVCGKFLYNQGFTHVGVEICEWIDS